jgi:hypothetical protein
MKHHKKVWSTMEANGGSAIALSGLILLSFSHHTYHIQQAPNE